MVSTRKKRQSNKRLLSQLDDFEQDVFIGNTASKRQENVAVNEGINDQEFTVGTSYDSSTVNGNAMSVKTLERCFNERIDREMNNIVDTVEDRIQNAILAAIDNIIAPKIELAIRSINASSERDATSVSALSERREYTGINASLENASVNNDTLGVTNINDETRCSFHDRVNGLSARGTQFDRRSPTHCMALGGSTETHHSYIIGFWLFFGDGTSSKKMNWCFFYFRKSSTSKKLLIRVISNCLPLISDRKFSLWLFLYQNTKVWVSCPHKRKLKSLHMPEQATLYVSETTVFSKTLMYVFSHKSLKGLKVTVYDYSPSFHFWWN